MLNTEDNEITLEGDVFQFPIHFRRLENFLSVRLNQSFQFKRHGRTIQQQARELPAEEMKTSAEFCVITFKYGPAGNWSLIFTVIVNGNTRTNAKNDPPAHLASTTDTYAVRNVLSS